MSAKKTDDALISEAIRLAQKERGEKGDSGSSSCPTVSQSKQERRQKIKELKEQNAKKKVEADAFEAKQKAFEAKQKALVKTLRGDKKLSARARAHVDFKKVVEEFEDLFQPDQVSDFVDGHAD